MQEAHCVFARSLRCIAQLVSEKIQDAYQSAYFQCALNGDKIPSARAIQTLVQVWREMRGWSKRQ